MLRGASASRPSASTFITEKEFAGHYAAAAFAARHQLYCETAVTFWWGALGALDGASAQEIFTDFLKHLNAWLHDRHLPTVYFFSHESSPRIGVHTHLAVYLCLLPCSRSGARDEFRRWAMGWPERNGYGSCPRAIRVTGPAKRTPWLHWHRFHYQVKGYDPRAVVQRAYNSPSGTDVMLGDLIAWPWQDPGVVTLKPRLGSCLNLGPARREIGIPKYCDEFSQPAAAEAAGGAAGVESWGAVVEPPPAGGATPSVHIAVRGRVARCSLAVPEGVQHAGDQVVLPA